MNHSFRLFLVRGLVALSLAAGSLFLGAPTALAAPCGAFKFATTVDTRAKELLIVTHPSTLWDGRFASKVGMDAAVGYAKHHQIPVVYLEGEDHSNTYFFSDCSPDYWILSYGGEFSFPVVADHVYSVGGHWEMCQRSTQHDLMRAWKDRHGVDLVFTQVLDGIYAYEAYVQKSDPYYVDFMRFIDIISFRKPGDDKWPQRKLNLLELMGVINNDALAAEHLKRGLPNYDGWIAEEYEVVLVINGRRIETLRKGQGEHPPTLTFEFIDSLYESGYARSLR